MKIHFQNFRCYSNHEFDLGLQGLTLLSGPSGIGKTTIMLGINFALFGKGTKLISEGKTSCKVTLDCFGIKIVRSKGPNKLSVYYTDNLFEGDAAQSVIDNKFSKIFDVIGYISQNDSGSFILKRPLEKLEFLERFACSGIDMIALKKEIKELLLMETTRLKEIQSKIDAIEELHKTLQKPTKIPFPLGKKKDKEKSIKNELIRLSNTEKSIKHISTKLDLFTKELNDVNLLNSQVTIWESTIEEVKTKIDDREVVISNSTFIGEEQLEIYQEDLEILISQRRLAFIQEKYDEKKLLLSSLMDNEEREIQERIIQIDEELQEEYSEEKLNVLISEVRKKQDDLRSLEHLESKISHNKVTGKDIEIIELKLSENSKELEKMEELSEKLKLQKEIYKCPSCDSAVKIEGTKLILVKDCIQNEGDLDALLHNISSKKKEIGKVQKELTVSSMKRKIYLEAKEEMKELKSKYTKLESMEELTDLLQEYRDSKTKRNKLNHEKKEKLNRLENKIYSKSIKQLEIELQSDGKRLAKLSKNKELSRQTEKTENELINIIKKQEKEKEIIDRSLNEINAYKKELEKLMQLIKSKQNLHRSKYKKMRTVDEVNMLLQKYTQQLNDLEQAKLIHLENKSKIDEYKKYQEKLEEYNRIIDTIGKYKVQEKIYLDKVETIDKFKRKVNEAENLSLESVINSINCHAQTYLDQFFQEDPISVILIPFKETKTSKKPQIVVDIEYKGIKSDLSMLSGGETSRVVLAFTLALGEIFNTPLILLDECTSSLDQELTSTIISALRDSFKDKLVIVIAHQCVTGLFDQVVKLS